jgi:hypothetical protein
MVVVLRTNVPLTFGATAPPDAAATTNAIVTNAIASSPNTAAEPRMIGL